MNRKRLGRAAVRFYPDHIRAAQGEELLGTLLDAGERSRSSFTAQLWSVILGGLLARSHDAWAQPTHRIVSDTVRWCAVIFVSLQLVGGVVAELRWGSGSVSVAYAVCPALILAAFLLGLDRAAGFTGIGYTVYEALRIPFAPTTNTVAELILLIGFALMTIAPRRRADDLRILVLVPLLAQALIHWTALGMHSGAGHLLPALAAALLITLKPGLALGTATACSLMSLYYGFLGAGPIGIELLCCTPAALLLAAVTRHALDPARR